MIERDSIERMTSEQNYIGREMHEYPSEESCVRFSGWLHNRNE